MTTDLFAAAVSALDDLLLSTVEVDDDGPDGGELVANVCAAVAERHGSSSWLVAGRPGSWEADLLDRLVKGTVGWHDEYLAEHGLAARLPPAYIDERGRLGFGAVVERPPGDGGGDER